MEQSTLARQQATTVRIRVSQFLVVNASPHSPPQNVIAFQSHCNDLIYPAASISGSGDPAQLGIAFSAAINVQSNQ
jgi:hypothetical protein